MNMDAQDLIPGLPDDIARHCLLRVDYDHLYLLSSVSRRWRQELLSPDFARRRGLAGAVQSPLLVFCVSVYSKFGKFHITILLTFNPTSGKWRRLPPIPAARHKVIHHVVGAGHRIAAIHLSDIPDVHVFDLLTGTCRHGSASPTAHPPRLSACASDGAGRVFFAGGVDHHEQYSPFAMSYDVEDDTWVRLPNMANPRSSCKGFFHAGTFYVVEGDNNTTFLKQLVSAEMFDVSTGDWIYDAHFTPHFTPVNSLTRLPPSVSGECSFVSSPNTGKIYCFQFDENLMSLWIREGKGWDLVWRDVAVGFLPDRCLMAWKEGFVLVHSCQRADNFVLHFLSLEEGSNCRSWKTEKLPLQQMYDNVKVTRKFYSVITSGCYIQV